MKVRDSFAQRLLVYSLGAGTVSAGASAHATILSYSGPPITGNSIYFSLQNSSPPSASSFVGNDFELNQATKNFLGGDLPTPPFPPFSYIPPFTANTDSVVALSTGSGAVSTNDDALKLAAGDTIGGGSAFQGPGSLDLYGTTTLVGFPSPYGYWTPGAGTGYLGLEIVVGGQTDYGWAELTVNNVDGSAPGAITLDAYGVETSGASIEAGQTVEAAGAVPEPGCTAWLAIGAAGLSVLRRRAKK